MRKDAGEERMHIKIICSGVVEGLILFAATVIGMAKKVSVDCC